MGFRLRDSVFAPFELPGLARLRLACRGTLLILLALVACALPRPVPSSWSADEAPNYRRLENGLVTANVLTLPAIPKLATAGFKTMVDLRAPTEKGVQEEASSASSAGLRYVNIPVTAATLSAADVREFAAVLDLPENRPALVHCASGNRVGAMMELYRDPRRGSRYSAYRGANDWLTDAATDRRGEPSAARHVPSPDFVVGGL